MLDNNSNQLLYKNWAVLPYGDELSVSVIVTYMTEVVGRSTNHNNCNVTNKVYPWHSPPTSPSSESQPLQRQHVIGVGGNGGDKVEGILQHQLHLCLFFFLSYFLLDNSFQTLSPFQKGNTLLFLYWTMLIPLDVRIHWCGKVQLLLLSVYPSVLFRGWYTILLW